MHGVLGVFSQQDVINCGYIQVVFLLRKSTAPILSAGNVFV